MRVTVDIPDLLDEEAKKLAANKGTSVSSLYAAIERYVQALKREEAFEALEQLVGTSVSPDFDKQLSELRKENLER